MKTIIAFYKFVKINDINELRQSLQAKGKELEIKGTILVSAEGINSTICGENESIIAFQSYLAADERFSNLDYKESHCEEVPFKRMLVRLKAEIITMADSACDPLELTAPYLDPVDFEKMFLKNSEDFILVDTRNDYEVQLGTFKSAIDPNIKTFSQFPSWVDENLSHAKDKTIVTFCTGGVRCEKATNYMLKNGFKKVYQIEGGILNYFEKTKNKENIWEGECVVFDRRRALKADLTPSDKHICYVCLIELVEKNTASEVHPGGSLCQTCLEGIHFHRAERSARKLNKRQIIKN